MTAINKAAFNIGDAVQCAFDLSPILATDIGVVVGVHEKSPFPYEVELLLCGMVVRMEANEIKHMVVQ